jgi:heme/copper-type cytochrome/quinol oxidase subunit 2
MKGLVTVDTPEDFQKWMAEQIAAQAAEAPAAASGSPAAPEPAPTPATQARSQSPEIPKGGNS